MEVPYTRIVGALPCFFGEDAHPTRRLTRRLRRAEYKHKPNQPAGVRERPGTVIFKEYSVDEGDPYYPVPNPDNQALFEKYRALAAKEPGVLFVGRLASYKYARDAARRRRRRDACGAAASFACGDVTGRCRVAPRRYFNMDQAILNALELFDGAVAEGKLGPKPGFAPAEGAAA